MNSKQTTDLLIAIQGVITFIISVRAFYLYRQTRSNTLFCLGLSMAIIAVGGVSGLIGDYAVTNFNTFWFRYIGQTVSYLFIFLISLPRRSERYLAIVKRWHIFATVLLIALLILTSALPTSSDVLLNEALSGSRAVVCLVIFFNYYIAIYNLKGSRFSLLMCIAFFLITVGIAIYTMKFSAADPLTDDYIGDGTRLVGLIVMMVAFFVG